ncbi:hypothetical protein ONZ78_01500 [Lactobacillus mulieris]|uniref:hypothetical protein n=1 Tax=Lactobacillus TaxID=1578 RepID=UPI00119384BD|nr:MULTISPECIES: hypothetical protein [Lactobacillus]MCF1843908.1 hypothetical protein [Lactobacillus jensenii]MCW8105457.1 hypothetical protein [Lactobacillus mulieris]MDK7348123.1 hypothetical protein [Lactobacillus mulieris]TVV05904.1 hypothetical protein FOF79_01005 [Lactobacillus jensenii]
MRFDKNIVLINCNDSKLKDKVLQANITQMGLDQTIQLFGDAKKRPYVVRLPFASDVRTGYIKSPDLPFNLQISQAMKFNSATALIGVEYHGRL